MRLAFRNIVHDRLRFTLTAIGIAFSAFLVLFQASLLAGFERAASRVIDSIDADLWIMPKGVQAFDFSPSLPADYSGVVRGIPDVGSVKKIAAGITFWKRPNGTQKTVVLVGAQAGLSGGLPLADSPVQQPETVLVDESDLEALGVSRLPADIEINAHRRHVAGSVSGFGSFLGSPYVFSRISDTRDCLNLGKDEAMFLVLSVQQPSRRQAALAALRSRVPELDVLAKDEFSYRAKLYWTTQTGAGGALLTAAILGFIVGVLIVSQTVYATTMENLEEFATLKALGASTFFVIRLVVIQALVTAILGCSVGMLAALPIISFARQAIAWIYTPWQLFAILGATMLVLAALASIAAVRAAVMVEPGRVFRA